jgi:23S rRNA pseudouridine1911/1915/1917 synthase
MSRLDAPVSGVVLFARTSKAASRLTEQFRTREVEKSYWALVAGSAPASADCIDWIIKDEQQRLMQRAKPGQPGAQEARLSFRRLSHLPRATLLEVTLETGRKHQIRLQLSTRALPILGDRKYGSRDEFPAGIALHSRRLRFTHPTQGHAIELVAPLPAAWRKFGVPETPTG